MREERKGLVVPFRGSGAALKKAHVHRKLIARRMDQGLVAEVGGVAGRPAHAAVMASLSLALGTIDFKRRIARPRLAASGAEG
jgi:hypothetical protein